MGVPRFTYKVTVTMPMTEPRVIECNTIKEIQENLGISWATIRKLLWSEPNIYNNKFSIERHKRPIISM